MQLESLAWYFDWTWGTVNTEDEMIAINTMRLLKDIEFILLLPALSFVGLAINAKISQKTGFTPQKQRIALTFSLLLFGFCMFTMVQDRSVLLALWRTSPAYYSTLYTLGGFLTIAVVTGLIYWKLRPSLWRRR